MQNKKQSCEFLIFLSTSAAQKNRKENGKSLIHLVARRKWLVPKLKIALQFVTFINQIKSEMKTLKKCHPTANVLYTELLGRK